MTLNETAMLPGVALNDGLEMEQVAYYLMWFCFSLGAIFIAGVFTGFAAFMWKEFVITELYKAYKAETARYYLQLAERKGRKVRK